jgi:hypothetical protein
MEDPHKVYQKKLKEIGKSFGFECTGLETPIRGNLDCVWRLNAKF